MGTKMRAEARGTKLPCEGCRCHAHLVTKRRSKNSPRAYKMVYGLPSGRARTLKMPPLVSKRLPKTTSETQKDMRATQRRPQGGGGRGGRGFWLHFEVPGEARKCKKTKKYLPAGHFFPITESLKKNINFWTLRNLLTEAPVQARAPISLSCFDLKKLPNYLPRAPIWRPLGTKMSREPSFCDSHFSDLLSDLTRARVAAMEEWCFPLTPPGTLPLLI